MKIGQGQDSHSKLALTLLSDPATCPCDSLSLGYQWPESHTQAPG